MSLIYKDKCICILTLARCVSWGTLWMTCWPDSDVSRETQNANLDPMCRSRQSIVLAAYPLCNNLDPRRPHNSSPFDLFWAECSSRSLTFCFAFCVSSWKPRGRFWLLSASLPVDDSKKKFLVFISSLPCA